MSRTQKGSLRRAEKLRRRVDEVSIPTLVETLICGLQSQAEQLSSATLSPHCPAFYFQLKNTQNLSYIDFLLSQAKMYCDIVFNKKGINTDATALLC